MHISRRSFLGAGGAALAAGRLRGRGRDLKIGVTDWNLRLTGKWRRWKPPPGWASMACR